MVVGRKIKRQNLTLTFSADEKEKVQRASSQLGISISSFLRMHGLREADLILRDSKEDSD